MVSYNPENPAVRSLARMGLVQGHTHDPESFTSRRGVKPESRVKFMAGVAVGAAALALLLAAGSARAEELPILKVGVECVDSNPASNDPRFILPPGIRVSIRGEFPKKPARSFIPVGGYSAPSEVVWLSMTDAYPGVTYTATNAFVESGSITANFDRYLNSIRKIRESSSAAQIIQGDPRYIRPFNTYTITMGTGAYTTSETPIITNVITSTAFSAACVMGPKGDIFPYWSYPAAAQIPPMVNSPQQRQY